MRGRPGDERLAAHGAVGEIADGAVRAVARVGVEDHLAVHRHLLDHLRGQVLGQLVGALDGPELGDHEVGVDVVKATGPNGAQVMDRITPWPTCRASTRVRRWSSSVSLVEEARRRLAHAGSRPQELEGDHRGDHRIIQTRR